MRFPWLVRGELTTPATNDPECAATVLEKVLRDLGANSVERECDRVQFMVDWSDLASKNRLFVAISSGELIATHSGPGVTVQYTLVFKRLLLTATAMILGFF